MSQALIITARVPLSGDIMVDADIFNGIRPAIDEFKAALATAGLGDDAVVCRHDFGAPVAAPAVEAVARKKRGPNKPKPPVEAANGAAEHVTGE